MRNPKVIADVTNDEVALSKQKKKTTDAPLYGQSGTDTPWYKGWGHLTEDERAVYRDRSAKSNLAKKLAVSGKGAPPVHEIYKPRLDPNTLMPLLPNHGLRSLSLFSGGGGIDLGFDRAGYTHVASYELLDFAGETLKRNRPNWDVFSGNDGDVTKVDWKKYRGLIDVIHGGPPCQPFSSAGHQAGKEDARDMFPEFVRSVKAIEPLAFVAENVAGLAQSKFEQYLFNTVIAPLSTKYEIHKFFLTAASFGVPQNRRRLIIMGFKKNKLVNKFIVPPATHSFEHLNIKQANKNTEKNLTLFSDSPSLALTMGVREALGLPDLGFDALSPTLRCTLTGPRHTTSIVSSVAASKIWNKLNVWPNGVASDKEKARAFVAENGHYRLSVPECALLQGFPSDWIFEGAVYKTLGQIGNSVAPPMGYEIAKTIASTLGSI